MNQLRIPKLFIVGATKCATSTIWHWLCQNPQMQQPTIKETPFIDQEFQKGVQHYTNEYFPALKFGTKMTFDANPNLFVIPWAAERIRMVNQNAKIIICMRDPYERCYSHWQYFHTMRPGREPDSFADTISKNKIDFNLYKFAYEGDYMASVCQMWGNYRRMYIETSMYYHYIENFKQRFDQILYLCAEDMASQQGAIDTYSKICDFLEIDRTDIDFINRNVARIPGPGLREADVDSLSCYLYDVAERTSNATGIDFTSKWKTPNKRRTS